ncbi:MAG: hypothetical protein JST15_11235 [Bacteroidetes bacterium]|nr:hypothetical protein [Bacteroidota bacterium]
MKKYHPEFTNGNLDKELIWKKLYPGKEFGYGVFKNLISDFTKLAESFITNQSYKENELKEATELVKSLSSRRLISIVENKKKNIIKKFYHEDLKSLKVPVEEYFYQISELYNIFLWKNEKVTLKEDSERACKVYETGNFITSFINMFRVHYHIKSLELFKNLRNGSKPDIKSHESLNASTTLDSIPEKSFLILLNSVRDVSESYYLTFNTYYLGYKGISNLDDFNHYNRLKEFVFKNYRHLPYIVIVDSLIYLEIQLVFCNDKKITLLKKEDELLQIYDFRFKKNFIIEGTYMIDDLFVSFLTVFFSHFKLETLEQFTSKYKDYLMDESKENLLLFSKALGLFLKSDYRNSLKILSQIKLDTFIGKNLSKKVVLLVQYELNEYESFLYSSDAFKHFFLYTKTNEKQMTTDAKIFCEAIGKLFKYKDDPDILELEMMEQEIKNSKFAFKKWFLKKIDEIKFKNKSHPSYVG